MPTPLAFSPSQLQACRRWPRGIGRAAEQMPTAGQPPPPESVLTLLINNLAGLREPLVVVFDDYHIIESITVGRALVFEVERLPETVHMVVTTRADPALPLARLRRRGRWPESTPTTHASA